MSDKAEWTEVESVEDITDEIAAMVRSVIEGYYATGRIDWEDVWDRIERYPLDDGTKLSLPGDLASPVFKKLKEIGKEAQAE